jgi:hypothetical protein
LIIHKISYNEFRSLNLNFIHAQKGTLKYRHEISRYFLMIFQLPFILFNSNEKQQKLIIILRDNYLEKKVNIFIFSYLLNYLCFK